MEVDDQHQQPPTELPLIVIDGANLVHAFYDAKNSLDVLRAQNGGDVYPKSLRPIHICDFSLRQAGFSVLTILPKGMEHSLIPNSSPDELHFFSVAQQTGALLLAPCQSKGDDDVFMISVCQQFNGYLLSNDRFADHVQKFSVAAQVSTTQVLGFIQARTISFAWAGEQLFPHPLAIARAHLDKRYTRCDMGGWVIRPSFPALLSPQNFFPGVGGGGGARSSLPTPADPSCETMTSYVGGGSGVMAESSGGGGGRGAHSICYNCRGVGHISAHCPKPKNVECWHCRKM